MADRLKFLPRTLTLLLLFLLGVLAFATPAQAKVSIVPGAARGGETATFAFRMANQQSDTNSTRLELVIPQDKNIAFAEVTPANGWNATIVPRPLAQPMQVGDKTITQVVGSIVLDGGSVGPLQFEQFLITLGPLPMDGALTFDAAQTYSNGRVERWTGTNAPSISLSAANAPGAPPVVAAPNNGADSAGPADPGLAGQAPAEAETSGSSFPALALMWGALGLAIVIVALVGIRARLRTRQTSVPGTEELPEEEEIADVVSK